MSTTLAYQISVNITLTLDHAPAVHGDQVKAAVAMAYQTMLEEGATVADKTYIREFTDGNVCYQCTGVTEIEVPSAEQVAEQPAQLQ